MALKLFAQRAASTMRVRCPPPSDLLRQSMIPLFSRFMSDHAVVPGLKYMKSHEWVKVDGDVGTVGITDFAQSALGDVVFVDLPEVGSTVEKDNTFGVVESVKAASDVYSPVSGEVVEVNSKLESESGLVNTKPYDEGWIMKVKLSNKSEVDSLLDATSYQTHVESEGH